MFSDPLGVPKLSLGEKAILTATSEYVSGRFTRKTSLSDIISGLRSARISTLHSTKRDLEI